MKIERYKRGSCLLRPEDLTSGPDLLAPQFVLSKKE